MSNVEKGDEDEDTTSTTRAFVCEQQRLRVPATSDAGKKLKSFHDQIVELSKSHIRTQLTLFDPCPDS